MSLLLNSGVFTKELTNDTLTITDSMGVKLITVFNNTSVNGTVLGNQKLGSLSSTAINVIEGMTYTVNSLEGSTIQSLTITAPEGCTLIITAIV